MKGELERNTVKLSNQVLQPEEALYMLERNQLAIFSNGIQLSMQEAFYKLTIDHQVYQLYTHLRQIGYHVFRSHVDRPELYTDYGTMGQSTAHKMTHIFDLYKPSSNFRSTERGSPDAQVVLGGMKDTLHVPSIISTVPCKLAIVQGSSIQFLSLSRLRPI